MAKRANTQGPEPLPEFGPTNELEQFEFKGEDFPQAGTKDEATGPENPPAINSVYKKIQKVMESVERIRKGGHNDQQHYDYVQESDITDAIRKAMLENCLILKTDTVGYDRIEALNGKGFLTVLNINFTIVDTETGDSYGPINWFGEGYDNGDKGFYKAYTGAGKYFLIKTFMIPSGDDPEGDGQTDIDAHENKGRQGSRKPSNVQSGHRNNGGSQNNGGHRSNGGKASDKQVNYIKKLMRLKGCDPDKLNSKVKSGSGPAVVLQDNNGLNYISVSSAVASKVIEWLSSLDNVDEADQRDYFPSEINR